jgi:hypothetical protein
MRSAPNNLKTERHYAFPFLNNDFIVMNVKAGVKPTLTIRQLKCMEVWLLPFETSMLDGEGCSSRFLPEKDLWIGKRTSQSPT